MKQIVVGLDIGYSAVKAVYGHPDEAGIAKTWPAGAAPSSSVARAITGAGTGVNVNVGGVPWTALVGQTQLERTGRVQHRDYIRSDTYRALLLATLSEIGATEIDQIVTGLPVQQSQDAKDREWLIELMSGRHVLADGRTCIVKSVDVRPQPVGAWIAWLDSEDDSVEIGEVNVLVVDPGYYSFDYVLLAGGGIKMSSSGQNQMATSLVLEEAAKAAEQALGMPVDPAKIDNALRANKATVQIGDRKVEVRSLVGPVVKKIATQVTGEMKSTLRNERGAPDVVLVAGGGATLYGPEIRVAFPGSRVSVVPEPVLANARGFFLLAAELVSAREAA